MKATKAELAEVLGVDQSALTKWAAEDPPLPIERQGKGRTGSTYETATVIKWYVDRAVRKAGAQTPRDRLFDLQCKEAEIRIEKALGNLIPADRVTPALTRVMVAFRAHLLVEADKAATILEITEGVENKRAVLGEIVRASLEHLAQYDPAADVDADDPDDRIAEDGPTDGDSGGEAAAADDGGAMGRDVPLPRPGRKRAAG